MKQNKENAEERGERIRQEELKRSPGGSVHGGGLPDLIGGMSWRVTGILILVVILGFVVYALFFR
jgi:hypothetical protein